MERRSRRKCLEKTAARAAPAHPGTHSSPSTLSSSLDLSSSPPSPPLVSFFFYLAFSPPSRVIPNHRSSIYSLTDVDLCFILSTAPPVASRESSFKFRISATLSPCLASVLLALLDLSRLFDFSNSPDFRPCDSSIKAQPSSSRVDLSRFFLRFLKSTSSYL